MKAVKKQVGKDTLVVFGTVRVLKINTLLKAICVFTHKAYDHTLF